MKKKFKNKNFLLLTVLLIAFLGLFSVIFAAELETEWPAAPGGKTLTGTSTLVNFVDYLYHWGILIGGLAAFFALILAGFKYLTSIGDPSKMTDAKQGIISALAGLLLLLSTFLVLNAINPDLTSLQAPTTTIGGYSISTINTDLTNTPCTALKLYSGKNYEPDENVDGQRLVGAYFLDLTKWAPYKKCGVNQKPGQDCTAGLGLDMCHNLGDPGWFNIGWFGHDIPIGSIKMDGACVLNFYSNAGCTGDQGMTISRSDPNFAAYSTISYHSMKLVNRSGPTKPKVLPISSAGIGKDSSGEDCQITLNGQLTDMGDNDYVRLYFVYGDSPHNLTHTWPPFETINDIGWSAYNQPFPVPLDDSWKKVKQGEMPGGLPENYSYTVTTLATGTTYYWEAKAVAQSGGHFDVSTNIFYFTTPNVCP